MPSLELEHALLKLLGPLAAIAIVVIAVRVRLKRRPAEGATWTSELGIHPAHIRDVLIWVAASVAWMLGTNALMHWRGPWNFEPWQRQRLIVSTARILAVGVLGPIAEELIFRGFGYTRLIPTRLGVRWSIVVLGAAWALLHVAYGPAVTLIFVVYGILLGAARWRSGSVIVPILMHLTWNLFAVW